MCDFASEIKSPSSTIAPFGTIMSAIGNFVSAGSAIRSGKAQATAANYTADQMVQNANDVTAAGQREAEMENMKAKILASRAIAVAAAQGGDAGSPGVAHVVADIAGRGAYNAGVALYDAEARARQLRMGAEATRYEGEVMRAGGYSKAGARMFGAAGEMAQSASLFSKYGRGGPKAEDDTLDDAYDLRVGVGGNM
jgi:hypothetical protein